MFLKFLLLVSCSLIFVNSDAMADEEGQYKFGTGMGFDAYIFRVSGGGGDGLVGFSLNNPNSTTDILIDNTFDRALNADFIGSDLSTLYLIKTNGQFVRVNVNNGSETLINTIFPSDLINDSWTGLSGILSTINFI